MVIVAAVDRSQRGASVASEAARLAESFDDALHVVHVLTRSEFVSLGRTAASNLDESFSMDQVTDTAADIAAEAAEDVDIPVETVGKMGDPADVVVDYASDHDARYIVVGGRKRSPTGKAIFGSVAQSILLNASCPVVSVIE